MTVLITSLKLLKKSTLYLTTKALRTTKVSHLLVTLSALVVIKTYNFFKIFTNFFVITS